MSSIFFPIVDMHAPRVEDAARLCEEINRLNEAGKAVALYCRAGMGRTGTMLAGQLIWEGVDPLDALQTARGICRGWEQSDRQVEFLREFSRCLKDSTFQASNSPT